MKFHAVKFVKNSESVLNHAYVDYYANGKVVIFSTNLKESIKLTYKGEMIEGNKTFLVDGCDLTTAVNLSKKYPCLFMNGDKFIVNDIKLTTSMGRLESFPQLDFIFGKLQPFTSHKEFLSASTHVSDDETRYFMNGVFYDKEANAFVGTDGRRLIVRDNKGEAFSLPDGISPIIPPTYNLLNLLKDFPDSHIGFFKRDGKSFMNIHFYMEDVEVEYYIQLIEGQFPNWRRVLPEMTSYQKNPIRFGNKDMKENLSILKKFIDSKSNRVYCEVDNDSFTLTTENGKVSKTLKILPSGVKMDWAWNANYFLDALIEEASFLYPDPDFNNHRVLILKRIGDSEQELIAIMPMQE